MNKLVHCFTESINVSPDQVTDELAYQSVPGWDSIGHMALVACIEETFGVTLDTDDIISMNSVARAREILEKLGVGTSAAD